MLVHKLGNVAVEGFVVDFEAGMFIIIMIIIVIINIILMTINFIIFLSCTMHMFLKRQTH